MEFKCDKCIHRSVCKYYPKTECKKFINGFIITRFVDVVDVPLPKCFSNNDLDKFKFIATQNIANKIADGITIIKLDDTYSDESTIQAVFTYVVPYDNEK